MIDITGLREDKRPQSSTIVHALLDRLEAAEKERDELRAKIAEMEKQEPVGVLHVRSCYGEELEDWEFEANQCACDKLNEAYAHNPTPLPLYALPGAQARYAKNAVAYLDLGTGGYMDVGTDLTDEELAALPKGRHMLGIIGTYGVDGYVPAQNVPDFADAYEGAMEDVAIWKKRALEAEDLNRKFIAEINGPTYMGEPAQPAPSVPEGWLRAIDEALVIAHIGVANADDSYEQAKAKLDNLIGFHVDVATDPAVNGGYKLVPDDVVEQAVNRFLSWKLPKDFHPDGGMVFIPTKGRGYDSPYWPVGTNLLNAQQAREMLLYVLAAAPEAKP